MARPKERTLDVLLPLMRSKGARCSPEEFQRTVNRAFHAEEAAVYDQVHANLWQSLPEIWQLLVEAILAAEPPLPTRIKVLDVGCGTGMATALLMNTSLAGRVSQVVMLDPSPEMLDHARARARRWPVSARFVEGTLEQLAVEPGFDLVVASSVLHHIPDLSSFLARVSQLQGSRGIFLHLQDPNGDAGRPRVGRVVAGVFRQAVGRLISRRFANLVLSRVRQRIGRRSAGVVEQDYLEKVNARLIRDGIITRPLAASELWSVTDIHVPGLPYSIGRGVSLEMVRRLLPEYRLLSRRTYGFWGRLISELPDHLRVEERALTSGSAAHGSWIAAAWLKTG